MGKRLTLLSYPEKITGEMEAMFQHEPIPIAEQDEFVLFGLVC